MSGVNRLHVFIHGNKERANVFPHGNTKVCRRQTVMTIFTDHTGEQCIRAKCSIAADKSARGFGQPRSKSLPALRNKIQTYPLTPYTDYRAFLIGLGDRTPAEVDAFIEENKTRHFRIVCVPYLDSLASKAVANDPEFQTQEPTVKNTSDHYRAHYEQGNHRFASKGAKQLWLWQWC